MSRSTPAGLTALGMQRLSLTNSTALFDVPADNLKLQRSTGSAVVNIAAYKY